jgi:hypothetical protein
MPFISQRKPDNVQLYAQKILIALSVSLSPFCPTFDYFQSNLLFVHPQKASLYQKLPQTNIALNTMAGRLERVKSTKLEAKL